MKATVVHRVLPENNADRAQQHADGTTNTGRQGDAGEGTATQQALAGTGVHASMTSASWKLIGHREAHEAQRKPSEIPGHHAPKLQEAPS